MSTSAKQIGYVKKSQEKLDAVTVRPPKGTKDRWRAAAAKQGKTLQRFVIETMDSASATTDGQQGNG